MANRFFITGTDTGIGKTVISALLCAALDAIYWKPIQTGTIDVTDRNTVMRLAKIPESRTIVEVYSFAPPVSPHLAARLAGAQIHLRKITLPRIPAGQGLIVEGAGGALVPINRAQFMTDVMKRVKLPVLLVARSSLGTINHTLLSLAAIRAAGLKVRGVVMVGELNLENRKAIEHYGGIEVVGSVPVLAKINRKVLVDVFRRHFDRKVFQT